MSGIFDDSNRQIIPRWYSYKTASVIGDNKPNSEIVKPKIVTPVAYNQKITDWRQAHSIPFAIDVVGSALVIGDQLNPDAEAAAEFLLANRQKVSRLGIELARRYKNECQYEYSDEGDWLRSSLEPRQKISLLKGLVRDYPFNAIAWCDLAFYYAILGQKAKSEQCMNVALSLGKENRFILRSASRCFLHLEIPDKALFILRNSPLCNADPWLVSSEISIAEGTHQSSIYTHRASRMIFDANFSRRSIAELAGTLSTLEAKHGSIKKAKKYFQTALQDPNENTLTQAEWLAPTLGTDVQRPTHYIPALFEADARRFFREQKYDASLAESYKWLEFQPFSSRPAVFGSYVASICLQDDERALSILETAKFSSPADFLLNNNRAFSLASLGRIDEAVSVLSKITESEIPERNKHVLAATQGLISFRRGEIDQGRELYLKAISGFDTDRDYRAATIATFFLAREEALANLPSSGETLRQARAMAEKYGVEELVIGVKKLRLKSR